MGEKNHAFFLILQALVCTLMVTGIQCYRNGDDTLYLHNLLDASQLKEIFGVDTADETPNYEIVHVKEHPGNDDGTFDKILTIERTTTVHVIGLQKNRNIVHDKLKSSYGHLQNCLFQGYTLKDRRGVYVDRDAPKHSSFSNCGESHGYKGLISNSKGYFRLRPVPKRVNKDDSSVPTTLHFLIPVDSDETEGHHHGTADRGPEYDHPETADDGQEYEFVLQREKRATSDGNKYMELLVAYDKQFDEASNFDGITKAFQILNEAQRLFLMLKPKLHLTIKELVEGDYPNSQVTPFVQSSRQANMTHYLDTFCRNQIHYDVDNSILLTGLSDRVSGGQTIGMAYLSQTCERFGRCGVIHMLKTKTGVTVAHEIGHNLGMHHDCDPIFASCSCNKKGIMAPSQTTVEEWSTCSQRYYNNYLASVRCLDNYDDITIDSNTLPEIKSIISLNGQCGALRRNSIAVFDQDPCKELKCRTNGGAVWSTNKPALEGSWCDKAGTQVCSGGLCGGKPPVVVPPSPATNPPPPPVVTNPPTTQRTTTAESESEYNDYYGNYDDDDDDFSWTTRFFRRFRSIFDIFRAVIGKRSVSDLYEYRSPTQIVKRAASDSAGCARPDWYTGDWTTCPGNQRCKQTRTVWCTETCGMCQGVVDDSLCTEPKPDSTQFGF